jgi:hypothetical protein
VSPVAVVLRTTITWVGERDGKLDAMVAPVCGRPASRADGATYQLFLLAGFVGLLEHPANVSIAKASGTDQRDATERGTRRARNVMQGLVLQ